MIPCKASDADLARYVGNIVAQVRSATPAQHERGRQWYPVAHDIAEDIGHGDVRLGAGVLAALSPMRSWEVNQRIARESVETGKPLGHWGDALRKTERIMSGEDPEDVLPPQAKTWHFFRCIVEPDDPDPVVIDRHAHDVAVGEVYGERDRGLDSKGRYATLALAYRLAARQLDLIPSVCQATAWVAQIERTKT